MNSLILALKKQPVVYIARDLERALGLPKTIENYHIITNATPFAKQVQAARRGKSHSQHQLILIKHHHLLDTHELLTHLTTTLFLKSLTNPALVVFKNTSVIEGLCQEYGYKLLNPPAKLSQHIEEKISQLAWLGELTRFVPPHQVAAFKEFKFSAVQGKILQFNRAHTGNGTLHLTNETQFLELQKKFPDRPVRITDFIDGPMLTNNNTVWGGNVLSGPMSYQITGLEPFTDRPFATIGNDWKLPDHILSKDMQAAYYALAQAVGKKLAHEHWAGLFGIDAVCDLRAQKMYLIEINARQPASTTYESILQQHNPVRDPEVSITTFEAHLASLLEVPYQQETITKVRDGAQIIRRVHNDGKSLSPHILTTLQSAGFNVISYPNTKPGDDLLRIQSQTNFFLDHNLFNEAGKNLITSLT